jgi:Ca-activated chloride channel family protein
MLQIGVKAREVSGGDRRGAHLTVAVDVSSSMGQGERLGIVRHALRRLATEIGATDRISLVAFSEDAYVLADEIGPYGQDRLLAAIDSLAPESSTNIMAGLQHAYAAVYRGSGPGQQPSRVVLLTDGLAHVNRLAVDRIQDRLAVTRTQGVVLHVVQLARERRYREGAAALDGLAYAGGGAVHRAMNAEQLYSILRAVATGSPQRVAAEVELKVTFNPRFVLAYRLLGHEVADLPADPRIDFYAGQGATAAYEVQLMPGAEDGEDQIAVAELTWRDPRSGQRDLLVKRFLREQFYPTVMDAPLPIQAATVVAEAAEVLRGSPFIENRSTSASLERVLQRAGQLDPQLLQRADFKEFLRLMEQAKAAKPYRSGGRR